MLKLPLLLFNSLICFINGPDIQNGDVGLVPDIMRPDCDSYFFCSENNLDFFLILKFGMNFG